jgi:hypothetical protein
MLEPWIIEQIRRREEEERRRREERPFLELPLANENWPTQEKSDERDKEREKRDEPKRGVVIIGM